MDGVVDGKNDMGQQTEPDHLNQASPSEAIAVERLPETDPLANQSSEPPRDEDLPRGEVSEFHDSDDRPPGSDSTEGFYQETYGSDGERADSQQGDSADAAGDEDTDDDGAPEPVDSMGSSKQVVQTFSLLVMLAATLSPAIMYTLNLHDATPAQLLVAVCASLLCCSLAVWILDVTSTLKFKYEWVSRWIWVVALTAVVGAVVGVNSGATTGQAHPYEGQWEVNLTSQMDGKLLTRKALIATYSPSADSYWGYSDARETFDSMKSAPAANESDKRHVVWAELYRLDPVAQQAEICIYDKQGNSETLRFEKLDIATNRSRIFGTAGTPQSPKEYSLEFVRSRQ